MVLRILVIEVSFRKAEFSKNYCDYDRVKIQYWRRGKKKL